MHKKQNGFYVLLRIFFHLCIKRLFLAQFLLGNRVKIWLDGFQTACARVRTLRRGAVRSDFAHHASRSLAARTGEGRHLHLGAVGLTAVHRKRKCRQSCGNRATVSQQQDGCPRTGRRRCRRRGRFYRSVSSCRKGICAMQRPNRRNRCSIWGKS